MCGVAWCVWFMKVSLSLEACFLIATVIRHIAACHEAATPNWRDLFVRYDDMILVSSGRLRIGRPFSRVGLVSDGLYQGRHTG